MAVDRKKDWEKFSEYMLTQHIGYTQEKYSLGEDEGIDLMTFTSEEVKKWNILRYILRNINGHGKPTDFFKIAHYAQLLQTEVWGEGDRGQQQRMGKDDPQMYKPLKTKFKGSECNIRSKSQQQRMDSVLSDPLRGPDQAIDSLRRPSQYEKEVDK